MYGPRSPAANAYKSAAIHSGVDLPPARKIALLVEEMSVRTQRLQPIMQRLEQIGRRVGVGEQLDRALRRSARGDEVVDEDDLLAAKRHLDGPLRVEHDPPHRRRRRRDARSLVPLHQLPHLLPKTVVLGADRAAF